ncbi:peptidase, partial [Streptomyces sp. SID11233]|nr:peptidase [Streptomyces sp. SID11233]
MFFVRRRGAARLAAAAFVSGLVATGAITGAGVAAAHEASGHQGGATATLGGLSKSSDAAVIHENGKDQRVQAGLFTMAADQGGSLQTYCIDIHHPTQDG